jgi:medium-chain acyl-[acyl-carrier-protein] hydrolase
MPSRTFQYDGSLIRQPATPWLAHRRPNSSAAVRLFCFPYSGADASVFIRWAEGLPATVELCPVQLPGRGARLSEPLFNDVHPLAESCAAGLLPWLDKPFALFGHSLGALVAFELARHLESRHGLAPLHLFASGCGAPQLPERETDMHALPHGEFIEALRRLQGTPEAVLADPELRELVLPILRADFTICETYAYRDGPPLACPISAYGGLRDSHVGRERLEAWRTQTSGPFTVRMFPGDHFFLNSDRGLLLRILSQDLCRPPEPRGRENQ